MNEIIIPKIREYYEVMFELINGNMSVYFFDYTDMVNDEDIKAANKRIKDDDKSADFDDRIFDD